MALYLHWIQSETVISKVTDDVANNLALFLFLLVPEYI